MKFKIFMNEEKTKSVLIWENGTVNYAERDTPSDVWGPPIILKEAETG